MGGPRAPKVVPEGHQRCAKSNHVKPIHLFGVNPKTGSPFKNCLDCCAKIRALNKSSVKIQTWIQKRKSNPAYLKQQREGKQTARADPIKGAKIKEDEDRYSKSPKGIATVAAWRASEDGQKAIERGKEKWKANPKKKLAMDRSHQARMKKIKNDPGYALRYKMLSRLSRVITKTRARSKTIEKYTRFETSGEIRAHFESQLFSDLKMEDHGKKWQIAHRIPLCYFNHAIASEVAKAWSKSNLTVMTIAQNATLSDHIDDLQCRTAGQDVFPAYWNGNIPEPNARKALRRLVRKGVAPWPVE